MQTSWNKRLERQDDRYYDVMNTRNAHLAFNVLAKKTPFNQALSKVNQPPRPLD